ncbi:unnamed protein product [Ectocarpus sp. 12 AP-2014]
MVKSAGSTVKSLLHRATRKEGLPRPGTVSYHPRTLEDTPGVKDTLHDKTVRVLTAGPAVLGVSMME